jgi:hypothetical protein
MQVIHGKFDVDLFYAWRLFISKTKGRLGEGVSSRRGYFWPSFVIYA